MIRRWRRALRPAGGLWAALALLLLAFRASASGLAPAPEGYVPICKDGGIVWIALDGGPDKTAEEGVPCPWLGLGPALPAEAPAAPAPPERAAEAAPLGFVAAPAARAPLPYRSRAPPPLA
ncbi:MAG: hypothetical protein ACE37J_05760 [Pikeienuella sp.]|uniref:hypothetical protein n=1 Tax=Pikeienuella sp. TaxID=2831957 RepID=UPI0039190D86